MIQLLQSYSGTLAAVAVIGGLLLVVNYGGAVVAWLRKPKAAAGWKGAQPAPAGFAEYLAAVEAACSEMQSSDVLKVLRGGLCPNAAAVVKQVKG